MTEKQEVQWGEWVQEYSNELWRESLDKKHFQDADASYLNALEREVRDLRAYKVLADEMRESLDESHRAWLRLWIARYDALPGTSEGAGK